MSLLQAVLFDFDDTLSDEAGSFEQALREVAEPFARQHGIALESLIDRVCDLARDEWRASAYWRTHVSLGVGWSEVFAGGFKQGRAGTVLEAEGERIRPLIWCKVLAETGIRGEALVSKLSEETVSRGTGPHNPYPGVRESLSELSSQYPVGLVTNGNPDIQRRKVSNSGLGDFFNTVVVAGDPGVEALKPDPKPFQRALSDLGADPGRSVMIGNDQVNDIHGAASLGMKTVWVNFTGAAFDGPTAPDHEISDMSKLPAIIDGLF